MTHPRLHAPSTPGFLPFKTLAEKPLLWIGFAALLGWVDLLLCFEGVLRDVVTMKGGLVHDPLFLGATLTAGCALVLLARRRQTVSRAIVGAAALVGAGCSAGAAALVAVAERVPIGISLGLGVALGLCIAVLALAWARELARLDLRAALLVVSVGACLQWVLLVIASCTGLAVHLVLAVAAPLVAGWTVWRGDGRARPAAPARQQSDATLPRMAGAVFVFSLVAQFIWSYFIKMLPGHLEPSLFPLVFVAVAVAAALAGGTCAFMMERQGRYRLELYYRLTFLVCLGGAGAMGLAAADLTQAELFASYTTVYAGYSLLGPTMWMLALGYAFMRSAAVEQVAGLVFGGQYLGLFLGFDLVEILSRHAEGQALGPLVVFLGICALGGAYTMLFPERSLLALSPRLFGLSPASIEERCEHLARRAGLTPREFQVLCLLAHGRDAGYICDELGIARNTVNAHRKAVFAKLSIHSQQELLSAVENAE